jgi:hypothetical protein
MGLRFTVLLFFLLTAGLAGTHTPGRADPPKKPAPKVTFATHVIPFVNKYCVRCHSGRRPRGGVSLDKYRQPESLTKDRKVWEEVLQNVRALEMPPSHARLKPSPAEIEQVTGFLAAELGRVDCGLTKDPGRVTIRRLNRAEYNNTICDLVGVPFKPAKDFPADDVGYGFDNIGDVLSLPTLLMEKYLAAADQVVQAAFKSPAARKRLLIAPLDGKDKKAAARKIIGNFARRAFRRPVTAQELDRLVGLTALAEKNGDSLETGVRLALKAVLISPHFLFRIELDREPNNPKAVHPVSEYELATRLSYFLWSSMPDEELFRQAAKGTLRKNLEPQIRRMLKDQKAHALVENFGGQWLQTRNLKTANPNPGQFPAFTGALRADMLRETELFFAAVMKEDRSILDFIDADFTFLNQRLARHYGIKGVAGDQFRRVTLTGGVRGGVLTQASILTITSNPTRTSPVKRGKWILENILGTPPPPPPPDVPELKEDKKAVLSGSLRQRMEQHRKNPTCAICHQRMDPLGFGFENFDAVGAWRTKDGKFAIDPSGTLPGGKTFKGPAELKKILKGRAAEFSRCLADKMLTYALGRGLEHYDKCALDAIVQKLARDKYRFTTLVIEVCKSDPFQKRRGKQVPKSGRKKRGQDP